MADFPIDAFLHLFRAVSAGTLDNHLHCATAHRCINKVLQRQVTLPHRFRHVSGKCHALTWIRHAAHSLVDAASQVCPCHTEPKRRRMGVGNEVRVRLPPPPETIPLPAPDMQTQELVMLIKHPGIIAESGETDRSSVVRLAHYSQPGCATEACGYLNILRVFQQGRRVYFTRST